MASVPFVNGPSQVSAPEYSPLTVRSAASVALPVSVALHAGVGSPSTPAAKNICSVSLDPAIVPVTVPLLLR